MQPLNNNKYRIFKSRYDSIDSYLSSCGEKYNDIDLTIDEEIYKQLLGAGTVILKKEKLISKYTNILAIEICKINVKCSTSKSKSK